MDLTPGASSFAGLKVLDNGEQYTLIGYDSQAKQLVVDRTHSGVTDFSPTFPARSTAPLSPDSKGQVHLRVIVDAHSVEVFAANGTPVITQTVYPEQDATGVSLYAEGGTAHLGSLSLWHLGSVQDAGAPAEGPDSPGAGKPAVQEPARGQAKAERRRRAPPPLRPARVPPPGSRLPARRLPDPGRSWGRRRRDRRLHRCTCAVSTPERQSLPHGRGHTPAAGDVRRRRGPESCPRRRSMSPPGRLRTRMRTMSPAAETARCAVRPRNDG